jgi:large subunit ribosomal protein L5
MAETKYTPRLKGEYNDRIKGVLTEKFGYTNPMQMPRLDKIVLNMGIGEAVADSKKATAALKDLAAIAGQKPVATTPSPASSCAKAWSSAARSRCAATRCTSSSTA